VVGGLLRIPGKIAEAPNRLGVGLNVQERDKFLPIVVVHPLRGLVALPRLDPREQPCVLAVHAHLLSTTRTAFPSLRGIVLGGTMLISGLRPRWPRSRSATTPASAVTSTRRPSKPPHASTVRSAGSPCTAS